MSRLPKSVLTTLDLVRQKQVLSGDGGWYAGDIKLNGKHLLQLTQLGFVERQRLDNGKLGLCITQEAQIVCEKGLLAN